MVAAARKENFDMLIQVTVAIVRLLRSDLPIAVYPCGADNADSIGYGVKLAPFSYYPNNLYWKLPNSDFINQMDPRLCRYLLFAYQREGRADFLHATTKKRIYYRGDAVENEKALQEALPALYTSFNPDM